MAHGYGFWDMTAFEDLFGKGDFDPVDSFVWMLLLIWKWNFLSSLFVYLCAALIATCTLRRHRIARYYALVLIIIGFFGPCSWGLITTMIISAYWTFGEWEMERYMTLLFGFGLTLVGIIFCFLRLPSFL
ncbi:transmembrane protein 170A-like [Convolutriloba macropyga]|uniref:transmembrane protein 170A-like n=1 Tax=Convolutriloba macropyga TaxID=536237 RepID=UPI003F51DA05